ncbi:MAG: class I SAM-dependent methyltransferase, partial [Planctomycetota bacterium]
HGIGSKDGDRRVDWSGASDDYVRHRPGPPEVWYRLLDASGALQRGARVLDLGTGVGHVARTLAARGHSVAGIDVAEGQVAAAARVAEADGLRIDFRVAPAEALPFEEGSFDVATAHQCWLYFDPDRVVEQLRRVLLPGGRLITGNSSWLPREDPLVHATEQLILEFNPDWSAAGWSGEVPTRPAWAEGLVDWRGTFVVDVDLPFDHQGWRGRIRASRGIGATLPPDEVERFDAAHAALLERMVPDAFTVRHRVDAHWYDL